MNENPTDAAFWGPLGGYVDPNSLPEGEKPAGSLCSVLVCLLLVLLYLGWTGYFFFHRYLTSIFLLPFKGADDDAQGAAHARKLFKISDASGSVEFTEVSSPGEFYCCWNRKSKRTLLLI